jgi:hypothetical protein
MAALDDDVCRCRVVGVGVSVLCDYVVGEKTLSSSNMRIGCGWLAVYVFEKEFLI